MLSLVVSSTGYASVAPMGATVQRCATPAMGFGKAELEGARPPEPRSSLQPAAGSARRISC